MKALINLLYFAILLVVTSCAGGGTSGTGTSGSGTTLLKGVIRSLHGEPVSMVTVTIISTQESGVSNSQGEFAIETSAVVDEQIELSFKSPDRQSIGIEAGVVIPSQTSEPALIEIDVVINSETNELAIVNVAVRAKIVGTCDLFFENHNLLVRQANRAPQGIECTLKVWVSIDNQAAEGVPFLLEYRACTPGSPWVQVASSETLGQPHSGRGQLQFNFFDDFEHCVYRVSAPHAYQGLPEILQEIHTFTKQSFDSAGEL